MKSRCNQPYQYFKKDKKNIYNLLQFLKKVSKNLMHSEIFKIMSINPFVYMYRYLYQLLKFCFQRPDQLL